jgi:hypothetical protein
VFFPTFVIGIAHLNPDLILTDLHWKRLQVIAFVIEASSALQIEAPPVPVACQNAMPDRSAGQGIAHMGALVVRSVDPSIDIEERDAPTLPDSDGFGFALLNVADRRYVYPLR